jgi:hypothetical protein
MNEITQKYKPFCYYLLKMIRIFLLIPLAIIFHKLNIYLGNINGKWKNNSTLKINTTKILSNKRQEQSS